MAFWFLYLCFVKNYGMQKYVSNMLVLGILFLFSACNAQPTYESHVKTDRQPAVAGSFYPASRAELTHMLEGYFNKAPVVLKQQPLALIVPHAGYVFSGSIAATGYRQIDRDASFQHVFIIGSSHTTYFEGASVYTGGDFITPLGRVEVDTLADMLDRQNSFITNNPEPHAQEHGIEVQLPFLQYWLKKPFRIVPVIVGGESAETCRKLASALKPYFTSGNLFIISTDFAHYPSLQNANRSDSLMAQAICSNSPKIFLKTKFSTEGQNIPGLETAVCGWTSVLTLLDITEGQADLVFRKITHRTSGDSEYGEKDRVVGYCAIAVLQTNTHTDSTKFELSMEDRKKLLAIARNTIGEYVRNRNIPEVDKNKLSSGIQVPAGAFVTLMENGELRGCIGNFSSEEPLYKTIQEMAIAAATNDYRFDPVRPAEISKLTIEISVLTPMRKIKSIDEIELGKHGIYIRKGNKGGTFLPQVASEMHWTKEEFLGYCSRDKAFIGWDGWKEADIYVYEALVFSEDERKAK